MAHHRPLHLLLTIILILVGSPAEAAFIRPATKADPLVYGVKNGIMVAIHPFGLDDRTRGGPRGLIRVGYQDGGKYYLINYIALEPIVGEDKGFSELEKGGDGQPGKRFWIGGNRNDGGLGRTGDVAGEIHETSDGPVLTFVLHVERFANGAQPVVEISLFEKFPHRIRFRTFSGEGGKEMQQCILTATMGNQSRCRTLWLKQKMVFAPTLYAGYTGNDFVEKQLYKLADLQRTQTGDVVAAISPDEFEPREVWPLASDAWRHTGQWMSQFWLKPKGSFGKSLHCRVNGRRVYWGGTQPLPGGIAYENFEFREDFRAGQELWFGYTTDSPAAEFGFGYDSSPQAADRRHLSKAAEAAIAEAVKKSRPLINDDFTAGLDGWQIEGGAKGFRTYNDGKVMALTTFGKKKEGDTGRLSQSFKIPADASYLCFALHGGEDKQKVYVALWQGDRLYRKMTSRNDNTPFRVVWDVASLRGEVVTLEVVDESTDAWGFIGIQEIAVVAKK